MRFKQEAAHMLVVRIAPCYILLSAGDISRILFIFRGFLGTFGAFELQALLPFLYGRYRL